MNLSALLTSAGINIALCIVLSSLYSILRKQPSNASVYYGQRFAQIHLQDQFCLDRLVPSAGWIVKAWEATEEDILKIGGLDAVVFLRIVVFWQVYTFLDFFIGTNFLLFEIHSVWCLIIPSQKFHRRNEGLSIYVQGPFECVNILILINVHIDSFFKVSAIL